MKPLLIVFGFAALAAGLVMPDVVQAEEPAAALDVEKLVGQWTFVSIERDGQKSPDERLKGKVIITKDTLTLKTNEGDFVMKHVVDPAKKPAAIALTITQSPFGGAGYSTKGIIELMGDQLRLCYAEIGEEAPKEFASPAGNTARFIVLKRIANE